MDYDCLMTTALVVHAVCSAVTATVPTPPASSRWAWVYKLIEILGLVIGRAKDR